MNPRGNDRLRETLAAQYAIGTLRGGARRRFERWLRDDAGLDALVREWQAHLQPFADGLAPVVPSPAVWAAIEARLGHGRTAVAAAPAASVAPAALPWYERLGFWRGFSALAVALAVFSIGLSLRPVALPPAPPPRIVAVAPDAVATIVEPKSGVPVAVVYHVPGDPRLAVRVAAGVDVPAGKVLQLWIAPADGGALESAGLLPDRATERLATLPLHDDASLARVKAFGLSLEPAGGSPQPTKVLGLGALMRVTG